MRPSCVSAKPPRCCPDAQADLQAAAQAQAELLDLLHGRWRVATRLLMLVLSLRGWPPAAIAELLGYDPRTVRRWIHRYNHHGAAGLADRPRPGRPRLGGPKLAQRIRRLLAEPRAWTVARVWRRLGRPRLSLRTLHRRIAEQARWRRPRLVAKGDPDAEQIVADLRRQLAQLPEGSVVLAEDETHRNLLPWVGATWILKGQRQRVMTPGKNRRRTIFGAIDRCSGRFVYLVARKAISANFTALLEQVAAAWPDAPVIAVVCDNVIIHHSKLVQRWLAAHARVRVLHGARYSPHHNPVERVWGSLKRSLANTPTLTMAGRIRQVHAFFRQRSPGQLLATAAPWSSPWLPEDYGQNFWEAA